MKKIVIVSKVIVGIRPNPFGLDQGANIFKKSLSENLKENLEQELKEKSMDYKVFIDYTYDSLKSLIQDGASLLLISPYIKGYVDINNIDEDKYYILSEKEFNTGYVNDIISYLERLDSICI
ncbi:MAG: hypothetical protein AB2375_07435 [Tissierellaceae bacterium]